MGIMGADAADAIGSIAKALRDENATVRLYAARSLGASARAPGTRLALTRALDDEKRDVREAAGKAHEADRSAAAVARHAPRASEKQRRLTSPPLP